jgi:hypothetical protein
MPRGSFRAEQFQFACVRFTNPLANSAVSYFGNILCVLNGCSLSEHVFVFC